MSARKNPKKDVLMELARILGVPRIILHCRDHPYFDTIPRRTMDLSAISHRNILADMAQLQARRIPWTLWSMWYGHVFVSREILDYAAQHFAGKPILSVGAGMGLLEHALEIVPCLKVRATDATPWCIQFCKHMVKLDAQKAVQTYAKHYPVLLIAWPDTSGYDSRALDEFSGSDVVIIGEDPAQKIYGSVGSAKLWTELESSKWTLVSALPTYKCPRNTCTQMLFHFERSNPINV